MIGKNSCSYWGSVDDDPSTYRIAKEEITSMEVYLTKREDYREEPSLLYRTYNMGTDLLRQDPDYFDWYLISIYQNNMDEEFIKEFHERLNMFLVIQSNPLSESFMEKYSSIMDWTAISIYQNLSEEFIERNIEKIHFNEMSLHRFLSNDIIRKYKEKLNWKSISVMQKRMGENFMEEMEDKIDWSLISLFQELSDEFILKYLDRLDLHLILSHQVLIPETKEKILKYLSSKK